MAPNIDKLFAAIDETVKGFDTLFADIARKDGENASPENHRPEATPDERILL